MKIKGIRYIIIVSFIVMVLGSVMIYANVLGHSEKNNKDKIDKVTVTTSNKKNDKNEVIGDKVTDRESGVVIVNSEIKEINLKNYNTISGYNVSYAYDYFNPVKINTSTLALINNNDNNVFIKIELLSEVNYYNEYNNSLDHIYNKSNELEGYNYEYKFIRGNGLYLKVTKCIHEVEVDASIEPMLDYMINSLEIN